MVYFFKYLSFFFGRDIIKKLINEVLNNSIKINYKSRDQYQIMDRYFQYWKIHHGKTDFELKNEHLLTLFVSMKGYTLMKRSTIFESHKRLNPINNCPSSFSLYSDQIHITVYCTENFMTNKNQQKYQHEYENKKASYLANAFDSNNNHCITGDCVFVFEKDDEQHEKIINWMNEKLKKKIL